MCVVRVNTLTVFCFIFQAFSVFTNLQKYLECQVRWLDSNSSCYCSFQNVFAMVFCQ